MEKETFVARALFERHYLSNMRRVLAVGDIHGRFDLLQQRLDQLDFDPEQDVAILLGDLVDRSDGSLDALEWCARSEEHTYELQSLLRISYAVFCLKKKKT